MDETQLDSFSRGFAGVLLAAHPEYRSNARVEEAGSDDGGYLVVEIPCPSQNIFGAGVLIDTASEEITISFDAYHTHFPLFESTDTAGDYEAALKFIDDLLSEHVKVVSWWSGETWKGSTILAAGEAVTTSTWIKEVERVRVRSWSGSCDQDRSVD